MEYYRYITEQAKQPRNFPWIAYWSTSVVFCKLDEPLGACNNKQFKKQRAARDYIRESDSHWYKYDQAMGLFKKVFPAAECKCHLMK